MKATIRVWETRTLARRRRNSLPYFDETRNRWLHRPRDLKANLSFLYVRRGHVPIQVKLSRLLSVFTTLHWRQGVFGNRKAVCLSICMSLCLSVHHMRELWQNDSTWWTAYVACKSPKGVSETQSDRFLSLKNFFRRKSATKFLCMKTFTSKVVRHSLAYLTVHKWLLGSSPSAWNF